MKFSWQLTNSFLELPNTNFQKVLNKLILSGIEIDRIDETLNDKILDLSITTNRKEINSALSLAREISIITNNEIKINPIVFHIDTEQVNTNYENLDYVRIQIIHENLNQKTPKWILEYLKIYGEDYKNNLKNIQQYIYLKWGITFKIVNTNTLNKFILENNDKMHSRLNKEVIEKNRTKKQNRKIKLLIFTTKQKIKKQNKKNYDVDEFYENYYTDSINIIKESMRCTIGKHYEAYKKFTPKYNQILVEQQTLNKWLGNTQKKTNKFLEVKETKTILEKLKFFPKYIKNRKIFAVDTPEYRKHDIKNKIDVIEEIGRIYEFQNFYNKYQYIKKTGKKSNRFMKVIEIRNMLRSLGLNEVINSSLTNNSLKNNKIITIHNPINEEHKNLRSNIISGLINNYIHNLKYTERNLLIFEIGKTFQKDEQKNKCIEEKSLGGLIYNPNYHKSNWEKKPTSISIFHIKGILELFLEKINAKVYFDELKKNKINNSMHHILKKNKIIGIYSQNSQEIIGILGELNDQLIKTYQSTNEKIFLFEIQLDKLINTTYIKKHLNYNKKAYSEYPSITRDISISIKKYEQAEEIKNKIKSINEEIIETIEIFNEYKSIKPQNNQRKRFIGIRIKYRSLYKTLNAKDIKKIDEELNNIIKNIN
uniref:phenylalanine--tRNA ligase n=1 Tax=Polysiphonia elongata TaxID=159753 RepID=A0A1Z1MCD3_9FLOR|nr:Phenylalanine-tRNA ligase beta subunit [Polysiphonia elongata]ARW63414.1 Phenylalanine-tRNA ligase beta subunit [Polysiphonia elongata]